METIDQEQGRLLIMPVQHRYNLLFWSIISVILINIGSACFMYYMAGLAEQLLNGRVDVIHSFESRLIYLGLFGFLGFVIFVLSVVWVCMWVHRMASNIETLRMPDVRYTPGWCVGWFFIPIANWFMPFICLNEKHKASQSINTGANSESWKMNGLSISILIWQLCSTAQWIYSLVNGIVSPRQQAAENPIMAFAEQLPNNVTPTIIGVGLQLVMGICLILYAKNITKMQNDYINASM